MEIGLSQERTLIVTRNGKYSFPASDYIGVSWFRAASPWDNRISHPHPHQKPRQLGQERGPFGEPSHGFTTECKKDHVTSVQKATCSGFDGLAFIRE